MNFFKKRTPDKTGGEKPDVPVQELGARAQSSPDEVRRLFSGESATKRGGGGMMVDPTEVGGKIRPQDKQPELSVSDSTDMLQILSEQAGLKYVKLADYPKAGITVELLKLIPSHLARSYSVFPVRLSSNGTLTIAISDPLNVQIVDTLRAYLTGSQARDVETVVANEEEIIDYINLYYGVGDKSLDEMVGEFEKSETEAVLEVRDGILDLTDLDKVNTEVPIIRFCNLLLLQAIRDRASDLHIEPFSNSIRIRYRVDGVLREIPSPPKSWQAGIISRFKVVSRLDIAESRRPQDGRIKIMYENREIDVRVATVPVIHGESIVMRLLDKSMMLLGVEQIGMSQEVLEHFVKLIRRPNGIILVTGPTGCGKTTTLYSAINEINSPTEKIITTEDPVEYQVDGIVQVNINANVGLTFARCLRAILRQDPDIILVGEVRDVETAQIAIQASLTGHLVFSTLHTNSAALTVTRLVDMGCEPFLITSTLEGIIGQRLVRTICLNCKRPYRPNAEELADFGTNPAEVSDISFFKGTGCQECSFTGYRGRLGIFELMAINDPIRDLILERATTDDIQSAGIDAGMRTMRQDGWMKIMLGITTFEEVARHTPREAPDVIRREMEALLRETVGDIGAARDAASGATMGQITTPEKTASTPGAMPVSPEELAMPLAPMGDADKA